MVTRLSSVFLSGWEYNRLLHEDVTAPRNSALPAAILWAGGHQLWMFETVYCSADSFLNEVAATDQLGWVMGEILRDLVKEGVLRTVDWSVLGPETIDALKIARSATLSVIPEDRIRAAIRLGDAATLELAKAGILEPILASIDCVESGGPNSINNWFLDGSQSKPKSLHEYLADLARPVIGSLAICRSPGASVSKADLDRQQQVQQAIEKPMIADLLAGDGHYAGPEGYEPYFRNLAPHKDAYEPVNAQLRHDWRGHRADVLRLRDAASRHLWPELHQTWLPLLRRGDGAAHKEFERWIKSALRLAPIIRYLNAPPTKIIVGSFGPPALTAALAWAGVPLADAVVGGGLAALGATAARQHFDGVSQLALFYQEALKAPGTP